MEDKKMIEKIYSETARDVFRYSYFHLKNRENAEDVTMDTFRRLLEKGGIGSIENIKPWVIGITRNIIFEKYRELNKSESLDNLEYEVPDYEIESNESIIISEQQAEQIKEQLDKLDERTREVIILKIWENMKFSEISEVINEKESTAKLRYYRGLEKLKINIQKNNQQLLTLGTLALGIGQIGMQPELIASVGLLTKLSSLVSGFLNLNVNLVTMENIATGAGVVKTGFLANIFSGAAASATTKAAIGITSVVTVTGVGTGTYYVVQNQDKKLEQEEKVIVTPTPDDVNLAPEDEISDSEWNSYNINGFEFDYPKEYKEISQPPFFLDYPVNSEDYKSGLMFDGCDLYFQNTLEPSTIIAVEIFKPEELGMGGTSCISNGSYREASPNQRKFNYKGEIKEIWIGKWSPIDVITENVKLIQSFGPTGSLVSFHLVYTDGKDPNVESNFDKILNSFVDTNLGEGNEEFETFIYNYNFNGVNKSIILKNTQKALLKAEIIDDQLIISFKGAKLMITKSDQSYLSTTFGFSESDAILIKDDIYRTSRSNGIGISVEYNLSKGNNCNTLAFPCFNFNMIDNNSQGYIRASIFSLENLSDETIIEIFKVFDALIQSMEIK